MKNIKRKTTTLLAAIVIASAFTGCDALLGLLGQSGVMTIDQRITSFSTAINSDSRTAADILTNFAPADLMTEYELAEKIDVWNSAFPSVYQYTFTVSDSTVYTAVEVAGIKTTASGGTLPATYTFRMYRESSGNYLIQEIWETGVAEALIKKINF